jgi:hypothetical protein
MKLNRKQRVIGFFVIVALTPFAAIIWITRVICLILSTIFMGIDSVCSWFDDWIATHYNRFIKSIK